jgi:iron complex outermembrane receptor protein
MKAGGLRDGFLATTFLAGMTLVAQPAFAQNQQISAPTAAQGPAGPDVVDVKSDTKAAEPGAEIIVTGSLLRRTTAETPSPVTVLSSQYMNRAGITNINDAIRSISADSAGSISTGFQNGFSAGGAAVSLRGLGVSSTLTLIDGLRSTNYPLNDDGHNAYVDLNSIPFSIVDRVEVLKDGASSTYGADAIGGVVNIILKQHFTGIAGTVEGGISQRKDAGRQRANLTVGYGDYASQGWNVYLNGEYQHDGAVADSDRGFPYNTADLSSIGGLDGNTADSSLVTATTNAVVTRVSQTDLNNPLSGMVGSPLTTQYNSLNLNCPNGTYTVTTGAAQGTGCKHDITKEYTQIQPRQERYSFSGRFSVRLSDNIEGYVTGSYAHNNVFVKGAPQAIRQRQPFGAPADTASNSPGIVLPVYVCTSGVNCATPGAPGRRLNPNNPYAAAFAGDPANGAARIYYLFGDLPFTSNKNNEVFRTTAGLKGTFGDGWNWRVEGVYAKDRLRLDQNGYIDVPGLINAINTGSYNFVDPSQNSAAVRNQVSPTRTTRSNSTLASIDASISKSLFDLPGGPLQVSVGGQVRRETLMNRNQNFDLAYYNLTTSSAGGHHTVSAAFFEVDAPVLTQLEINASGRFDHYSEGYSHFSPKVGAKFTPIKELAIRGTFSKGFRAPTFAESSPNSQYAGFSTYTPPTSFQLAHGGLVSAGNTNPYAGSYSLGTAITGNPNLKPELSRSFTGGVIVQPFHWLSFTADYYNVRKTRIITAGPLSGDARAAYFAGTPLPAGYTVNTVDGVDPLFPGALPRVLIINAPFVNSASLVTSGLELAATASFALADGVKFTSRVDVTNIFKYNLRPAAGAAVQKYVGTLGPYELSSGAGTPKWRGNWQNTLEFGRYSLTATTYYVSHIKEVAADEGSGLDCATGNLYSTSPGVRDKFCYIKRFIYVDLNAQMDVSDKFSLYTTVGNLLDAKAPIAPASYSGTNYLPTWHYAGVIGRTFRVGANFKF